MKWNSWLMKPRCFWLVLSLKVSKLTYITFKVIISFAWNKIFKFNSLQQLLTRSENMVCCSSVLIFLVLLQLSAGIDTANCYQRENVQFKAKQMSQRMKCKTFEYYFNCITPGSHFSGSGNNTFCGFCDWYKYRYMVILLLATTTRRLSMQMEFG